MKRIVVCGGRHYDNHQRLYEALDSIRASMGPIALVITGGARGADALAAAWARSRDIAVVEYPADWNRYGRMAGPVRNRQMISTEPDFVVAFPGGKGTANLVGLARQKAIPVVEVSDE